MEAPGLWDETPSSRSGIHRLPRQDPGLWRAISILGLWAAALAASLWTIPLNKTTWLLLVLLAPLQSFLNVGLFITAHDAMHGTLLPRHPLWNERLGRACVWLYALFSYDRLKRFHFEHHSHPASSTDPDFHADGQPGFRRPARVSPMASPVVRMRSPLAG